MCNTTAARCPTRRSSRIASNSKTPATNKKFNIAGFFADPQPTVNTPAPQVSGINQYEPAQPFSYHTATTNGMATPYAPARSQQSDPTSHPSSAPLSSPAQQSNGYQTRASTRARVQLRVEDTEKRSSQKKRSKRRTLPTSSAHQPSNTMPSTSTISTEQSWRTASSTSVPADQSGSNDGWSGLGSLPSTNAYAYELYAQQTTSSATYGTEPSATSTWQMHQAYQGPSLPLSNYAPEDKWSTSAGGSCSLSASSAASWQPSNTMSSPSIGTPTPCSTQYDASPSYTHDSSFMMRTPTSVGSRPCTPAHNESYNSHEAQLVSISSRPSTPYHQNAGEAAMYDPFGQRSQAAPHAIGPCTYSTRQPLVQSPPINSPYSLHSPQSSRPGTPLMLPAQSATDLSRSTSPMVFSGSSTQMMNMETWGGSNMYQKTSATPTTYYQQGAGYGFYEGSMGFQPSCPSFAPTYTPNAASNWENCERSHTPSLFASPASPRYSPPPPPSPEPENTEDDPYARPVGTPRPEWNADE
ncbi:hypothetical protein QR680_019335 [Steinernema hermaphroditum]|uniref:Uncharacterized protein n=1 Tax=Steinernema hermaphroditum TaxID=289476 RepID=A0AA39GN37_9BILA|nr:hypothetical protein QR680_019335 [Steinernema hermaphroditum]